MNFADPTRSARTPFRLEREQRISRPLEEVFAFFAEPQNLEVITPPWMKFHLAKCSTETIGEGTVLEYALRVRGLPMRWVSLIREWDPPHQFVDEQLHGPYRRWLHRHTFRQEGSETVIGDEVDYAVPGGALIERLLVRGELERIFGYRQTSLQQAMDAQA